eukprot:2452065-Pleurochrysis_carterae.AAC.2
MCPVCCAPTSHVDGSGLVLIGVLLADSMVGTLARRVGFGLNDSHARAITWPGSAAGVSARTHIGVGVRML